MSRIVLVSVLVLFGQVAGAADLPPGAVVRLGDDRFRAGSEIERIAISPDGKQIATVRRLTGDYAALTLWDATTGRVVREHKFNHERDWNRGLFCDLVWGEGGGFAVFHRVEPGKDDDTQGKGYPDDFRIWDFTDPKAEVPPLVPATPFSLDPGPLGNIYVEQPRGGPRYTHFTFSADARRVAALWTDKGKHAVHVFEVKPTATAAKLKRVGTLDLGAEGADAIRLSADGKALLTFRSLAPSWPAECTATKWDVAEEKPGRPVRVRDYPRGLPLTPDGRFLVNLSWTETEEGYDLIDLDTGKRRELARGPRYDFAGPDEPRRSGGARGANAVFFPSGRVLVKSRGSGSVIDLTTGKELGRLRGHPSRLTGIAVSADGSCIATADGEGLIRLWNAKTLRPLNDAPGHRAAVDYAQLSPDGKRVLTFAIQETARLWDLATGKELRVFTDADGRPTFTPDGTQALYRNKDRLIARDLQTGLEVPLPDDMKKLDRRFALFSPDGKAVLTWSYASAGRACEVWDWPSGKKRFDWKVPDDAFEPGFSPDGSAIFAWAKSPERWDAKNGKELPPAWEKRERSHYDAFRSLQLGPVWVLHTHYEGDTSESRIIEAGTGNPVPRFRCVGGPGGTSGPGPALSPTGGQYATSFHTSSDVYLIESATGKLRRVLTGHRDSPVVLGFTPDGSRLLTAGGDHTVLVWDMRLQNVPLPDALKQETDAAKLWESLATGKAENAYAAMARLAREPEAAIKLVKMKLKPIAKPDEATEQTNLADARAIELLETLDLDDARTLLKELASGHADAFRTQEAKRALERNRAVTR